MIGKFNHSPLSILKHILAIFLYNFMAMQWLNWPQWRRIPLSFSRQPPGPQATPSAASQETLRPTSPAPWETAQLVM